MPRRIVSTEQTSATTARVTVRAAAAAAFVLLESHRVAGSFSDGAFAMLPGVDVALTFTARRALSATEWRGTFVDGLRVRSLRDTYD